MIRGAKFSCKFHFEGFFFPLLTSLQPCFLLKIVQKSPFFFFPQKIIPLISTGLLGNGVGVHFGENCSLLGFVTHLGG